MFDWLNQSETVQGSAVPANIIIYRFTLVTRQRGNVPQKVPPVLEMETPTNVSQLHSAMRCFSYCWKVIFRFSTLTEPLYALLKNVVKFAWTTQQEEAFETLKHRLTMAPVRALPRDDVKFILNVDASDRGLEAVFQSIG